MSVSTEQAEMKGTRSKARRQLGFALLRSYVGSDIAGSQIIACTTDPEKRRFFS
ncbi:hypothetical protein [Antarcticirhabdus aurantiaca]|uniref:Uncharacterized protein n=1 Tax=Antarcticirhabdus aurantiaca TaxID=2606717 RepID=A0ACD4NMS3_9HYPH|nr:hypothetical protein [Antarcticirhabdus aurantiaca]WAJ28240.1 hypothetical protein OXU80_26045 [Jeongeuplla avenae]